MDEIFEQYKKTKERCKLIKLLMLVPAALGALLAVLGVLYMDSPVLFPILGVMLALPGIFLYIISIRTFKKFDNAVRNRLKSEGKSDEEISSILGDAK